MWPVMPMGASARARKGSKSVASSTASGVVTRGVSKWLSAVARPWPGMCLITGATPPASMPSSAARPSAETLAASSPKARSPITECAPGWRMSRQGTQSASIPPADSSAAISRWFRKAASSPTTGSLA